MSLPLILSRSFRKDQGFVLGKSPKRPGFFRTMEFENYIFLSVHRSDFLLPPKGSYRASVTLPFAAIQHGLELIFSQKILKLCKDL